MVFTFESSVSNLREAFEMIGDYFNRAHVTPKNDPNLSLPVKIRVLVPFYVRGKLLEVDEVVTVEAYVARDMVALKKAEYVR